MKRFLLFAWYQFYPEGGMNDFVNSYDTVEEAKADVSKYEKLDYAEIIDSTTGECVADWSTGREPDDCLS